MDLGKDYQEGKSGINNCSCADPGSEGWITCSSIFVDPQAGLASPPETQRVVWARLKTQSTGTDRTTESTRTD